ncbi:MAG: 2-C-methyl-D-erythritol 4-phosphate cytidylyltransferase [Bacteroidetes bacterium]|nr:2-C-methyl-D-erythritol 4-phosphate cytidylyltransferase [Bacteroidota bacterium]
MKKYAVIVAAGSGTRMGAELPKQFLPLKDKPIILHTLEAFLKAYDYIEIILVVAEQYLTIAESMVTASIGMAHIKIVSGGNTRFQSVKNGLAHIPGDSIVFVHDAVRCLVTSALIHRCFEEAMKNGNAIPSVKPVDSIRVETHTGNVMIDRDKIHVIQTPQTFRGSLIKSAFDQEYQDSFTDEASVAETMGEKINLIEGELSNIKITRPIDLVIAERILSERN